MRTMGFTIEDNGLMLKIGQIIKEFFNAGQYTYLIEPALGMSRPYPLNE